MLWSSTLLANLLLAWSLAYATTLPSPITKSGCQNKCGNVSIPYPFGLGDGDPNCYQEAKFKLICNKTFDPPRLHMEGNITTPIIDISFLQGQLTLLLWISSECYTNNSKRQSRSSLRLSLKDDYKVSNTRNKFIAIGCDTLAYLMDSSDEKYQTGCISYCTDQDDVINGSCTGIGCCETAIPKGINSMYVDFETYDDFALADGDFSRCSYGFLADDQWFKFYVSDLWNFTNRIEYKHINNDAGTIIYPRNKNYTGKILPASPVVVDWAVGNLTCKEALQANRTRYACGENTNCSDSKNAPGYHCLCKQGFKGNPYLPTGCKGTGEQ